MEERQEEEAEMEEAETACHTERKEDQVVACWDQQVTVEAPDQVVVVVGTVQY